MTVPYDNFGKGSWNRPRDTKKFTDNLDQVNFDCPLCENTKTKDGKPCPKCAPHVERTVQKIGRTRIVYK